MKTIIKKILINLLLICYMGGTLMMCNNNDKVLSGEAELKEISLEGMTGTAMMDRQNQTVLLRVAENTTDLSTVKLNFTLSEGARAVLEGEKNMISGGTVNLSRPIMFTVIAPDGSRTHWTVAVTNNDYSVSYGLGYMITESKSLQSARGVEYSPYINQNEFTPAPNNNCGPSCAAMAVNWGHTRAKMTAEMARSFNVSVERWSPTNCKDCINTYGGQQVFAERTQLPFSNTDEKLVELYTAFLKETIDAGRLVITVVDNGENTYNTNPEQHTHRFYQSSDSHMLVYKGYKVVDGVTWIEVYDPAGRDDDAKYADGSWKGENRYYLASDLAKHIPAKNISVVITVWHTNN